MNESTNSWNTTERDWLVSLSLGLKNMPKDPAERKAVLMAFDQRWSRWADSKWDSFILQSKAFDDLQRTLKNLVDSDASLGLKALSSDDVIKNATSIDWQLPVGVEWIPVGDLHLSRPFPLDYVDSGGADSSYTINAAGYRIPVQIAISFRPTRVAGVNA